MYMCVSVLSERTVLAAQSIDHSAHNYLHVKHKSPVLYIPDIILHPLLHLPQLLGLTAETAHLRQPVIPGLIR